jgi:hypothetical protein
MTLSNSRVEEFNIHRQNDITVFPSYQIKNPARVIGGVSELGILGITSIWIEQNKTE